MATIEEMLEKDKQKKKPFKKTSYRPWESSFLDENNVNDASQKETDDRLLNPYEINNERKIQVEPTKIMEKPINFSEDKLEKNNFHVDFLQGVSREIMFQLVKTEEHRDDNFIYCKAFKKAEFSELAQVNFGSITTSIARLRKKGYLNVESEKRGKGGCVFYSIPILVYNEIIKFNSK
ncbi:MAG: hypothetical protein Q8S21_02080 [Candidatus Paracaedibacteraceae bacterium]|nr:hypothetical protein [Candidatus Paracaedibacteraceae bacterium]